MAWTYPPTASGAERVVQAVDQALPEVEHRTFVGYERCLPHAQERARLIEQAHLTSYAARRLLYQTGFYLENYARYSEAEAFYQHSLRIREQALGPDHPLVATSLNNLANLYAEQGKYDEAEPLYQGTLRKMGREAEASELEARFPSTS